MDFRLTRPRKWPRGKPVPPRQLAVVIVASSLLAALYLWRVVAVVFFERAGPGTVQAHAAEAPWTMVAPVVLLAAANVWFGVETSFSTGFAALAGAALAGGGP